MKYFAPTLLPRNKWFQKRENVQVGDLVLELNPNRKRSQWEMALITNTYPGSDGLVRKVRIRTRMASTTAQFTSCALLPQSKSSVEWNNKGYILLENTELLAYKI